MELTGKTRTMQIYKYVFWFMCKGVCKCIFCVCVCVCVWGGGGWMGVCVSVCLYELRCPLIYMVL